MIKIVVVLFFLITSTISITVNHLQHIEQLVKQWAPLIWISPDEEYYPSSVGSFLENVHLANEHGKTIMSTINETHVPHVNSKSLYLVTSRTLDNLENDKNSFLRGYKPHFEPVPLYTTISPCTQNYSYSPKDTAVIENDVTKTIYKKPSSKLFFSVSYWAFYPYNKGKEICFIGNVPTITIFGRCFGHLKTIGSHLGDWEHITLSFKGNLYPSELYIGIHGTGDYYKVVKPKLAPIIRVQNGHPVLFSATGSHGFWPSPGEHEYVRIPFLTDKCGYGTAWKTWENLEIFTLGHTKLPSWLLFKGKWGNPKNNCIFSKKIGLCEHTEGPEGILRNKQEFLC